MDNVVKPHWLWACCTREPSFNLEGSKMVIYCKQHAGAGMVNLLRRYCSQNTCATIERFNIEDWEFAGFSTKHAKNDMVDAKTKFVHMSHVPSDRAPNSPSRKATYCKLHAIDGIVISPRKCDHIFLHEDANIQRQRG